MTINNNNNNVSQSLYVNEIFGVLNHLDSPNLIHSIVAGDDFLFLFPHDSRGIDDAIYLPYDPALVDGSILRFMNNRVFGCLEGIYLTPFVAENSKDVVSIYRSRGKSQGKEIRLANLTTNLNGSSQAQEVVGALLEGETTEDIRLALQGTGLEELKSIPDMYSIFPLRPSDYAWDGEEGQEYFTKLLASYQASNSLAGNFDKGVEGSEEEEPTVIEELQEEVPKVGEKVEPEQEEKQEEVTSTKKYEHKLDEVDKSAIRAYKTLYTNAVDTILYNYKLMFTAAYQLKRPYGILTVEEGEPEIVTIKGTSRELASRDLLLLHDPLVKRTINASGLKVCKTRNAVDISDLILKGKTRDGSETASLSDRLYFPNKMLEFAYGLDTPKITEGGRTNYPRHSQAESWDKYSYTVKNSLEQVFEVLVVSVVRQQHERGVTKLNDVDTKNRIMEAVTRLKNAFLTCILVAESVQIGGELGLLKLKILDPYELDISRNIATDASYDAYALQDSVKSTSRMVITDKASNYYSVHTFEGNSKMVTAMPMFAYKAAEAVMRSGRELSYKTMILGIDTNDNILQNGGGKVDMTPKITHYTVARSRAGKGVEGLSKLANAIKSGKPVFYLDNKPDMASMVLELCEDAFAVNGGDSMVNPDGGTNIQKRFTPEEYARWGKPELIPKFLYGRNGGIFDSGAPHDYGNIYYLRAVLLIMAIIDARVRIPGIAEMDIFKGVDGEDAGLVAFFDEFNNLNDGLRRQLGSIYSKEFASTNYYLNEKKIAQAQVDGVAEKDLPKQTQTKPSPSAYWVSTLVEKMISSAERISKGKNAGYGNGENSRTDIYVIGQELPDIVEGGLSKYYPERMATVNKAKVADLKDGYYPLAPLVTPFGQDIIVGFSNPNYLNQKKGGSYASDKLNEQNRMFAYVDDYSATTRKLIENGDEDFASTVPVYYKPFLILPKSDHDMYYVQNSMGFLDKAGLNVEEVLEQNALVDENDEPIYREPYDIKFTFGGSAHIGSGVQLNPAVGLKGYLNFIGVSDDLIKSNLRKSGDIAQKFMELIGYQGTWREFIMDLRPEYIFSIDDIYESITTKVPLSSITTVSSGEFYYVYQELFTTSTAYDPEGTGTDEGGSVVGMDPSLISSIDDEMNPSLIIETELPENYGYGGNVSVSEEDIASGNGYDALNINDGLFDERVNPTYDTGSPSGGTPQVSLTEKDRLTVSDLNDILSMPKELQVRRLQELLSDLEGSPVIASPNDNTVGYSKQGISYDSNGSMSEFDTSQVIGNGSGSDDSNLLKQAYADNFTTLGKEQDSTSALNYTLTYPTLMRIVTNKAINTGKSQGGIRSVRVEGGALIVNDVMVGLKLPKDSLTGLPDVVLTDVVEGRLAKYFNWRTLLYNKVVTISIDSSRFVFDYLATGMGYSKSSFSVRTFFEDLGSLQKFTVDTKSYNRKTVMSPEFVTNNVDDMFYQPRRSEQAYRLTQSWLRQKRINSFERAFDVWRDSDKKFIHKALVSGFSMVGAGLGGATESAGFLGNRLFRGIRGAVTDVARMVDESRELQRAVKEHQDKM